VGACVPTFASCAADPTPGTRPPPSGTLDPFDGTSIVGNAVEFIFTSSNSGAPATADFVGTPGGGNLQLAIFNPSLVISLTVPDIIGWVFTFPDRTITSVEVDFGRTLLLSEVLFGTDRIDVRFAQTVIAPRQTAEVNFTIGAIPEPTTGAMLLVGLLAIGAVGRRDAVS